MVKQLVIVGLLLTLVACSATQSNREQIELQDGDGYTLVLNHGSGYVLRVPDELLIWGSGKFFSTVQPPKPGQYPIYTLKSGDSDMQVLTLIQAPCTPSLTGASQTQQLTDSGADTSWGRVDFWDIDNVFYHRGIADLPSISPLCPPPIPSNDDDRLSPSCGGKVPRDEAEEEGACGQWRRDYELEHGLYSAYALCSERDGKTVVICLSQMTDDPKMAEEIFSTFRWME